MKYLTKNILLLLAGYLTLQVTKTSSQHATGIPSIVPNSSFDPEKEADLFTYYISQAKEPKDEEQIMTILTHKTLEQRQQLYATYEKLEDYSNLTSDIIKFKFPKNADVLSALFITNAEIYAHHLCWAIRAVKMDKYTVINILCCVDEVKMEDIIDAYNNYCGANADLKSDIERRFSGQFGKLLGAILEGKRRPSIPGSGNMSSSEIGVVAAEECMWIETIWDPVIKIFSQYSYEELVYFARQHLVVTGLTLEQSIRIETAGLYYFRRLLLKILQYAGDPTTHYAGMIQDALITYGLKNIRSWSSSPNQTLTSILVTRSEVDLKTIAQRYKEMTYKNLEDVVKATVPESFKTIFVKLIQGNNE